MTIFANLHAGPGVGKSTVAAKTFALMKEQGLHVELVTEYVKTYAWEKRIPVTTDQFLFFGKQTKRETLVAGQVDFLITDAPSILTAYYTQVFGEPSTAAIFRSMALEYRRMMETSGHRFVDIWLRRTKQYDPRGRFQTKERALEIDEELLSFLKSMRVQLTSIDANELAAQQIVDFLRDQK
jgi:hypothetical protein